MQCLGFLDKRNKGTVYSSLSQKDRCQSFLLHFISDKISLRLFTHRYLDFVKRWGMVMGRHSEHQTTKLLLVKVSYERFPIELCVSAIFVTYASISAPYIRIVIAVWLSFYVFWIFSFHLIDYFTYFTRKVRYRARHANPSNRPTEVSLHLKVGNSTKKNNRFNFNKCQKEYVPAFYKTIC